MFMVGAGCTIGVGCGGATKDAVCGGTTTCTGGGMGCGGKALGRGGGVPGVVFVVLAPQPSPEDCDGVQAHEDGGTLVCRGMG